MAELWGKTSQKRAKKAIFDLNFLILKATGSRGVGCWDRGFALDSNGLSSYYKTHYNKVYVTKSTPTHADE